MDISSKMKIMVANTRDQIYTPLPLLKTNIFPLNEKPENICLMFDYPHRAVPGNGWDRLNGSPEGVFR